MNPMQQMLINAQQMQRKLKKAHEELDAKEYSVSKNGMVEIVMKGNREIVSLNIDADALDADNKDMLEETIALALNEVLAQIKEEADAVDEKITGQSGLMF